MKKLRYSSLVKTKKIRKQCKSHNYFLQNDLNSNGSNCTNLIDLDNLRTYFVNAINELKASKQDS